MAPLLDETIVERVSQITPISWSGDTYRHTAVGRDALSGLGAQLNGGRWNPPDVFGAVYLATPLRTALREFDHAATSAGMMPEDMISVGRELHTVSVLGARVLDLREAADLAAVGLSLGDIQDDDMTACQAVGHAAWFLEIGGVLAPSARDVNGLVVAIFESRVAPGVLTCTETTPLGLGIYQNAIAEPSGDSQ